MNLRVLGVIVVWPVAAGAATCESLKSLPLADTTITIADTLLELPTDPAVILRSRGGKKTTERGPEYFKKIAGMKKTKGWREIDQKG